MAESEKRTDMATQIEARPSSSQEVGYGAHDVKTIRRRGPEEGPTLPKRARVPLGGQTLAKVNMLIHCLNQSIPSDQRPVDEKHFHRAVRYSIWKIVAHEDWEELKGDLDSDPITITKAVLHSIAALANTGAENLAAEHLSDGFVSRDAKSRYISIVELAHRLQIKLKGAIGEFAKGEEFRNVWRAIVACQAALEMSDAVDALKLIRKEDPEDTDVLTTQINVLEAERREAALKAKQAQDAVDAEQRLQDNPMHR